MIIKERLTYPPPIAKLINEQAEEIDTFHMVNACLTNLKHRHKKAAHGLAYKATLEFAIFSLQRILPYL